MKDRNIDGLCKALRLKLPDRESGFGKEYIKLLVDEIGVGEKRVDIRGSYLALAQAIGTKKLGRPEWVPSFGDVWLPGQDSNLQPSG